MSLEYCLKLFKKTTAERFAADFVSVLESISCTDIKKLEIQDIVLVKMTGNLLDSNYEEDVTFNF
ncbi:hypothetical protein D3C75_1353270 [compost metagenome]